MESRFLLDTLEAQFPDAITATHDFRGDQTAIIKREAVLPVLAFLRDDPACAMNYLMDLTVVDYLTYPEAKPARYEVVYHLYSMSKNHRVRLKAPVNPGEAIASATPLWASADWMEREAWEMFGVKFEGHPNLKRLLTHIDFVGHPLRKDYPLKKRQPLAQTDTLMDEMDRRLREKGLK